MKPIKAFGEWIAPSDALPPEGVQVIVKINYHPDARFEQIAVMSYKNGEWFFQGSGASPYKGKYIQYWLKDLTIP